MDDLEPVATLSNTYFYIALSLGTPLEVVEKWQSTLDSLKADGTFEKIYRSYIPNADVTDLLNTKESAAYYPGECSDLSSLPPKEKELVEFVCKAKAFALANMKKMGNEAGLAATFKEFDRQASDPDCKSGNCPFQQGELYMFAYENEMQGWPNCKDQLPGAWRPTGYGRQGFFQYRFCDEGLSSIRDQRAEGRQILSNGIGRRLQEKRL